jgi:hypothetical protein
LLHLGASVAAQVGVRNLEGMQPGR